MRRRGKLSDAQSGIPGLMDLPILGALFRRETKVRSRTELLVLIHPSVLFTAQEGSERSRELSSRLSIHPNAASSRPTLGAFEANEAPRPPLTSDPLREILKFQSGLPDGR